MKKLFLFSLIMAGILVCAPARGHANIWVYSEPAVCHSSRVAVNQECAELSNAVRLRGVVISSATNTAGAYIELYDGERSTMTARLIDRIPLEFRAQIDYDLWLSSGLTYRTVNNAAGVVIKFTVR